METGILRMARHAMGTEFQVVLIGDDPDFLRAAGHEALDEIERLEARLSHYLPASEISDLNRRGAEEEVLLEPGLLALLSRAVAISEDTGGAFDPTAGALVRCWGFFRGQGAMPRPEDVEEARERTGRRLLEIDSKSRTAHFSRTGVEVHLGAIGKGYAVDEAAALLRMHGVETALIHGGTSTVYGLGAPPGAPGWAVGIRDPRRPGRRAGVVYLKDRALSISGDYEQFFEHEGVRYSHILDPRTGWPARGMRTAVVLAEGATETDAYSTAAFILGEAATREICGRNPGLGAILIPDEEPAAELKVITIGDAELAPPTDFEEEESLDE